MSKDIYIPKDEVEGFCKRWNITEFALFGSAAKGQLRPDSDIDILVTFSPDARWTLLDHAQMQEELKELFGRDVDLVSRRGVERSRNALRKREILETAETIYVAA